MDEVSLLEKKKLSSEMICKYRYTIEELEKFIQNAVLASRYPKNHSFHDILKTLNVPHINARYAASASDILWLAIP